MAGVTIRIGPDLRDDRELRAAIGRLMEFGSRRLRPVHGLLGLFVRRFAMALLRARARDWGNAGGGKLGKSLAILLDSMSVTVGSNLVYAAIQQLGGKVAPKGGRKYLALPVLPALRRNGTYPRDLPRESMRFVPNAHIRIGSHSWRGPALVRAEDVLSPTGRKTKKREGQVMFALIKRASIKGREYLVFGPEARGYYLRELRLAALRAWGGR